MNLNCSNCYRSAQKTPKFYYELDFDLMWLFIKGQKEKWISQAHREKHKMCSTNCDEPTISTTKCVLHFIWLCFRKSVFHYFNVNEFLYYNIDIFVSGMYFNVNVFLMHWSAMLAFKFAYWTRFCKNKLFLVSKCVLYDVLLQSNPMLYWDTKCIFTKGKKAV